jgi:hypothetical protein
MTPIKVQLALFFKNTLDRPDEEYMNLNKEMNNLFNNTPTIIPVPDDAPKDIPVVQLSSKEKGYRANISRKRADLFFDPNKNDKNDKNIDEIMKDFNIKVDNFIDFFVNICRINRMGFVVDNIFISKDSVKKINKRYLKEDLSDSLELKLRFNRRNKINQFNYNNITDISNVKVNIDNKEKTGILIHKDLNNVQISDHLNKKQLINLFENFKEHTSSKKIKELI